MVSHIGDSVPEPLLGEMISPSPLIKKKGGMGLDLRSPAAVAASHPVHEPLGHQYPGAYTLEYSTKLTC